MRVSRHVANIKIKGFRIRLLLLDTAETCPCPSMSLCILMVDLFQSLKNRNSGSLKVLLEYKSNELIPLQESLFTIPVFGESMHLYSTHSPPPLRLEKQCSQFRIRRRLKDIAMDAAAVEETEDREEFSRWRAPQQQQPVFSGVNEQGVDSEMKTVGLKNGLRFHFYSVTCINYPFF